jgi:hypothetical protein
MYLLLYFHLIQRILEMFKKNSEPKKVQCYSNPL